MRSAISVALMLAATPAAAQQAQPYQRAVAAGCNIDFLRAAQVGDTLQAEAVMVQQGKRTGVYDVRVTNEAGDLVALMRGKSAAIQGTVLTASAATR